MIMNKEQIEALNYLIKFITVTAFISGATAMITIALIIMKIM
jgi:hypothetical protein